MVNAQEWLDNNYPKNGVRQIKDQDSHCYFDLESTSVSQICRNDDSADSMPSKLNRDPLKFLKALVGTKFNNEMGGWSNFGKSRKEITKLNISSKELEDELDLSDFSNLQILDCSKNQLTNLNLINQHLLTGLNCHDNKFSDLSFLTHLTNLRELDLSTNQFSGSLEPLKNLTKLKELSIAKTNLDSGLEYLPLLEIFYRCKEIDFSGLFPNHLEKMNQKSEEFKVWQKWDKNFSETEREQWKKVLGRDDYNFAIYLKKEKGLTPTKITKDLLLKLRREYVYFSDLQEIALKNVSFLQRLQFQGNIPEQALKQLERTEILEKIPYQQFRNIKNLATGGFSKISQAEWNSNQGSKLVVLKFLNDSKSISASFLLEITLHKVFGYDWEKDNADYTRYANNHLKKNDQVVKCHGISQDFEGNYVIVMELKGNNLRKYLELNGNKLDLNKKLASLYNITDGLWQIHKQGLIHKDLHPGNILMKNFNYDLEDLNFFITDLGLCRPANETNLEKVYGILPYVAPEVMQGRPYTQASDVYSFGIVAYELLANTYPYYEHKGLNDKELAIKICQGLRPNLDEIEIPSLLKDLIKSCWNNDSKQRPTAEILAKTIEIWISSLYQIKESVYQWDIEWLKKKHDTNLGENLPRSMLANPSYIHHPVPTIDREIHYWEQKKSEEETKFKEQCEEVENDYNHQRQSYQIHPNAITYSQPINTAEIARLFQESQEQAIQAEISKIEREINQPLTEELKALIKYFIQTRKKLVKDRKNKEIKEEAKKIEKQLKDKEIQRENIEKIIDYCKRFVIEQEILQTQIEVSPK